MPCPRGHTSMSICRYVTRLLEIGLNVITYDHPGYLPVGRKFSNNSTGVSKGPRLNAVNGKSNIRHPKSGFGFDKPGFSAEYSPKYLFEYSTPNLGFDSTNR